MAPRDDAQHSRDRGDRVKFNFLADRRLRFAVHTIGLVIGIVILVMFELPSLFGLAFIGWWVAWTVQREATDLYNELYEINDTLIRVARERETTARAASSQEPSTS